MAFRRSKSRDPNTKGRTQGSRLNLEGIQLSPLLVEDDHCLLSPARWRHFSGYGSDLRRSFTFRSVPDKPEPNSATGESV